jgi:hypothetical protein
MFAKKLAVVAIALSAGICAGQTVTSKAPEPKSAGDFFYLDPATQELKELPAEKVKFYFHETRSGSGFHKREILLGEIEVSGVASPFRIAVNDKAEFIFKTEDPEDARLFNFTADVKKNHRRCVIVTNETGAKSGMYRKGNKEWERGIAVNITKFGGSSYKLTPQTPLATGEYVLVFDVNVKKSEPVFTFAVGASGN